GAKEITLAAGTSEINYTTLELNGILLALELPVDIQSELEVRLKSTIAPAVAAQYSNVSALTATPYAAISYLYVPGAYQGWMPETAESLISPTSNGIYTGIIQFPEVGSMFKITLDRNWDNSYGQTQNGILALNSGSDIKATLAGNVEVTVNINTLSIAYKQHTWGLIGDATAGGWTMDSPMKYDNTTQTWRASVDLKKGNLKFRKNNDWGTNYGITDGVLTLGGGDIAIAEAGTYSITLDVTNEKYTLVKN
ncbi:SusF/SusE family outer membrane protein, partial [Sphingobacterium shayense]|uniref:SusF/SusE family outer membrane protein n=1 Tax=Sphingobacterium shayense TaxID=626343 RepID=UPI001554813E